MHSIVDLTSRECKAYIVSGGDLAFVPLGSVERLGPHLPLGARNIVVEAIAKLLAEKNNGLYLPVIPYNTLYDTFNQKGSIDIEPEMIHRYCTDICRELEANKLRRIVFVSFQEELYYLEHEYFQEHNIGVVYLTPDSYFNMPGTTVASLDKHGRELWRLVGCLRAMGDNETLERVLAKTKEYLHAYEPVVNKGRQTMDIFGRTGHKMAADEWRFYPVNLGKGLEDSSVPFYEPECQLLDMAKDELESWIDTLSQSVTDLSAYQKYLDTISFNRPV